ncbi:ISL3 family transposase, partial [Desulfobacterota bacterium M19]
MSTSILYHAFGLKGIEYRSTRYIGNFVIFSAEMKNRNFICPKCRGDQIIYKGRKHRWLRMPPIGRKLCILDLLLHRIQCYACRHVWWPRLSFMLGSHSFVRSFALYVQDMLKHMTIQDVASILGVGWDMIKNIHKLKLEKLYRSIPITSVTTLGIDEFSIRKRHSYMTIFVDLASGRIIHAVEGTAKDRIMPFLRKLQKRAKSLKAVAMDMSRSFFWAVCEALPKVTVVFDRFHIMALMNKALDEIRRAWQGQLDKHGQKTLKGSRFLFLRNYESLPETQKSRLDTLLEINEPL